MIKIFSWVVIHICYYFTINIFSICAVKGWGDGENIPDCQSSFFPLSFVCVKIAFFLFFRYGYMQRSGDWILGSWWDMVQLPATLLVVEVCCFLDGQLWKP